VAIDIRSPSATPRGSIDVLSRAAETGTTIDDRGFNVGIRSGDTLSQLAQGFGIQYGSETWNKLLSANPQLTAARNGKTAAETKRGDWIYPNERLHVPVGLASSDALRRAAQNPDLRAGLSRFAETNPSVGSALAATAPNGARTAAGAGESGDAYGTGGSSAATGQSGRAQQEAKEASAVASASEGGHVVGLGLDAANLAARSAAGTGRGLAPIEGARAVETGGERAGQAGGVAATAEGTARGAVSGTAEAATPNVARAAAGAAAAAGSDAISTKGFERWVKASEKPMSDGSKSVAMSADEALERYATIKGQPLSDAERSAYRAAYEQLHPGLGGAGAAGSGAPNGAGVGAEATNAGGRTAAETGAEVGTRAGTRAAMGIGARILAGAVPVVSAGVAGLDAYEATQVNNDPNASTLKKTAAWAAAGLSSAGAAVEGVAWWTGVGWLAGAGLNLLGTGAAVTRDLVD
jgi:hypothetical protein